jgi:hypothetical protein
VTLIDYKIPILHKRSFNKIFYYSYHFYFKSLLHLVLPCCFYYLIFNFNSNHEPSIILFYFILNSYHEPSGKKRSTPLIWLNSSCGEYHSPVLTVLQKMVQAWNFNFFVLLFKQSLIFQKKKCFVVHRQSTWRGPSWGLKHVVQINY